MYDARLNAGLWPWRLAWVYGSLSMGVFMVRTMKRVIFHESRQYGKQSFAAAVVYQ